ncbi:MAG: translation initiation factor eIF-2B [Candidatus Methanofastidiosia archaeon]
MIEEKIREIRNDNISGAFELTEKALRVFIQFAKVSNARDEQEYLDELRRISEKLIKAQPTMVSIGNLTGFLLSEISAKNLYEMRRKTKEKTEEKLKYMRFSRKKIIQLAESEIEDGDLILTHSFSSLVFEILKVSSKNFKIMVTESRPLCEGTELSKKLAASKPTALILDCAVGRFIKEIDKIFVGADCITNDYLINKIGTYPIALCAKREGVPFYALSETYKFNPSNILIEEKPSEEILKEKIPNLEVRNLYFDETPLNLVTKIIYEKGIFEYPFKEFLNR